MRILVVGKGGREHAICWKLRQEGHVVICAPCSWGILQEGVEALPDFPLDIVPDDPDAWRTLVMSAQAWALEEGVDLVIPGPEAPLVAGIADSFRAVGLTVFGPSALAAQIESNKAATKQMLLDIGVPTAPAKILENPTADEVRAAAFAMQDRQGRVVIKASGLAAGKGAIVAHTEQEISEAVQRIVVDREFGAAGDWVVVEKFMEGEEASLFAICDGENFVNLTPAQDHKAIGEGDTGPNTGGMGAYAPAPVMTPDMIERVDRDITAPVLAEMRRRGTPYQGALYVGLMITEDGPQVVEFNCRFGDPETQVVLPLLESSLGELCMAAARGNLREFGPVRLIMDRFAACVVTSSAGYPGPYEKGKPITGLDAVAYWPCVKAFHAGIAYDEKSNNLVTAGGRVYGMTADAPNLRDAVSYAYLASTSVRFEGEYRRSDIAHHALARLGAPAK